MSRKPGRQFFANPGPTNIPDTVLRAMNRPAIEYHDPEFMAVYEDAVAGLKRVLGTEGEVFLMTASGHGAWEAALVNLFSPGDLVLCVESGWFSEGWAEMARSHGLRTELVQGDWRRGPDIGAIEAALREDAAHGIKGLLCVHNETSTGVSLPIPEIRAALDRARHPALLLVDTVSSLGALPFHMAAWGVDAAVGGSQKGLMLTTGFSFVAASEKAMQAHEQARSPRHYLDWGQMRVRPHRGFVGTVPTQLFYGLQESVRLLETEGMDNVLARHARLAGAVRAAVRAWSGNAGPQIFCLNPARASDSVTTVLMPEGHDADALRQVCLDRYNTSLARGLGRLQGQVFRIGHLGDLNEPMVLGTLGAVELGLRALDVPHGRGGVEAAMELLAA